MSSISIESPSTLSGPHHSAAPNFEPLHGILIRPCPGRSARERRKQLSPPVRISHLRRRPV